MVYPVYVRGPSAAQLACTLSWARPRHLTEPLLSFSWRAAGLALQRLGPTARGAGREPGWPDLQRGVRLLLEEVRPQASPPPHLGPGGPLASDGLAERGDESNAQEEAWRCRAGGWYEG